MTSSGKKRDADADVLGDALYEGHVYSGQPLLDERIASYNRSVERMRLLYRGKFEVLRTYSSLSNSC